MSSRRSPTFLRRRLGIELRRLREQADLTIDRVAHALECSESKISRIETGQVGATPRDVRDMLQIYGVGGAEAAKLIEIAREARHRAWWHEYSDIPISALVGFEAAATSIRIYEALLVPSLFQTVEYARAVLAAVRPDIDSWMIERQTALRLARQRIVVQPDAPAIWAVLDEAVLRRPVGERGVMREQTYRLLEASQLPNVTLQVLPFDVGEHAGMEGSFTILSFLDPADSDIVFLENNRADRHLEDTAAVRQHDLLFDHLRAAALAPMESSAFLTGLAKEL